jgi:hypothetical protein
MTRCRQILLMSVLGLLAAVPAVLSDSADELEQNRLKLEKMKVHPEEMARLRKDAQFFLSLSAERRHSLMELDRHWRKLPFRQRYRLERTLDRYLTWLEQLEPAQREKVKAAPDKKSRLELIKQLKEDEWLSRQPAKFRDKLAKLSGPQRAREIKGRRDKEHKERLHWEIVARFWDDFKNKRTLPHQLSDFPLDVQNYVTHYLMPRLLPDEKELLRKASGSWPKYPMALVVVADRHVPALPDPRGPRKADELPEEVLARLFIKAKADKQQKQRQRLDQKALQYGGSPMALGQAVSFLAKNRGLKGQEAVLPYELWPYRQRCLSPQVQEFIEVKLRPVLDNDEKLELLNADANALWPDYPLKLKALAEKHNLRVPWLALPGPASLWDRYRIEPYDPNIARRIAVGS